MRELLRAIRLEATFGVANFEGRTRPFTREEWAEFIEPSGPVPFEYYSKEMQRQDIMWACVMYFPPPVYC